MRRLAPFAALFALTFSLSTLAAVPRADAPSSLAQLESGSAVNWLPWGAEAFARARAEQKPLYVFVGLATSELSRAMARQTFANAETAAFLNESFVCVLADANEHPQLVALYQNYLQVVKQLRGLPMNLWLTPELKPFDGANYLPPTEEWGKEGFLTVARRAATSWKTDPDAQRIKADEAVATVLAARSAPPPTPLTATDTAAALASGVEAWRARYDAAHGGFSEPPKHLEPELLTFLLRDPATRDIAVATLRAMLAGAIRDPLDGGFFRYTNDAEWRLPYFQKNLIDQARIALTLFEAFQITRDSVFSDAGRNVLAFILESLALEGGGFTATLDATTEAQMHAHLWTMSEIKTALGEKDGEAFCRAFGVTAEGNIAADAFPGLDITGENILRSADLAAENTFTDARATLLKIRRERAAPLRDTTTTAAAHGLVLAALCHGWAPKIDDAARAQLAYIREHLLTDDGQLRHLADHAVPATPQDYAMVIQGLLAFESAAGNADAGTLAKRLERTLATQFLDTETGRYFATIEDSAAGLWARVHAPAPSAGDPASAEATMLMSLPTIVRLKTVEALAPAIAAEINESFDAPRGDLLLALQSHSR
jgi:uncharacterized protein YyaL (SSP411 family)